MHVLITTLRWKLTAHHLTQGQPVTYTMLVVTDSGAARSIIDINGNISWTQGTGYIPITLKDSDASGRTFNLDLQDAGYKDDTAFPMIT